MSPMSLTSVLRGKLSRKGTTMQRRASSFRGYSRYDATLQLSINRPFKLSNRPTRKKFIKDARNFYFSLPTPSSSPFESLAEYFQIIFPRNRDRNGEGEGGLELEIGSG